MDDPDARSGTKSANSGRIPTWGFVPACSPSTAVAITLSRAVGLWRRLLEQMRRHFFFAALCQGGLWPLLRIQTGVAPTPAEGGQQSALLGRLRLPWLPRRFPTLVRAGRFSKEGWRLPRSSLSKDLWQLRRPCRLERSLL